MSAAEARSGEGVVIGQYAEEVALAVLRRHSIGAFNNTQSACHQCRKWMTHDEYREHIAALIGQWMPQSDRPSRPNREGRN